MASQDVEAGRAYVTLYLRRVGFDQQIDQLQQDAKQLENQPSESPPGQQQGQQQGMQGQQQPYTEAGVSMPADLASSVVKGGAGWLGGTLAANLARVLPLLRSLPTVAAGATAGVTALGTAATGAGTAAAAQATAATGAATATAATGTAAAAAAPAVAATGTAAAGAATGLAAMATAALPILVPLAALAAAATLVYVSLFKWQDLSPGVKLLLTVLFPIVPLTRLIVAGFKLLKLALLPLIVAFRAVGLAASVITAPFRLAAATVRGLIAAVKAIPAAITAIPGLLSRVGSAAWDMGKRVAAAAASMAAAVGRAAIATGAALAKLPGQLAGYAAGAVTAVSSSLQSLGLTIGKAGAVAAGLSAAIVGPLTLAAKQFADYGDKIRQVQNEYQRFALSAEEVSVIMRVSEQTGESVQKLAEQMREGTRDFSRWRNEVQASGMMMSGAGLAAALELSRAYYALRESLTGLRMALGEALGPVLTESTQVLTGAVRGVIRWVSENKPLIVQVFRIASAVGVAAGAVTTLGGAIAGAGAILSPFTAGLAAIAAGLTIVEVRTGTGRSIWDAYGDAVRRVYQTVTGYLDQMSAFVGRVMGGIKDALIGGDLAGAVNVAWAGAKVAWMESLLELDSLTGGVFGGILQNLASGRWAAAGSAAMLSLQIAWQQGIGILSGLWGRVVDAADTAWIGLQNGFDLAMGGLKSIWAEIWEALKRQAMVAFTWILNNVFAPLTKWIIANDPTGYLAQKAKSGLVALTEAHKQGVAGLKTPEETAADQAAIGDETAGRQQERQDQLDARRDARQAAADRERLAREAEVARLRAEQARLAREGANATQDQRSANQRALDDALAAAKAAREAAEAARPNETDFAVSTKTESITRFSAAAIELSIGRSADEPQKRIAKLAQDQLGKLDRIANGLDANLAEILRLQQMGGFA